MAFPLRSKGDHPLPDFLEEGVPIKFPAKKFLFMQSDLPQTMYYLVDGIVKMSFLNTDGSEKIIRFVKPGALLGECGVLLRRPYGLNASTVTECRLVAFDAKTVDKLMRFKLDFVQHLTQSLCWKLWTSGRQIADLSFENLQGKVINALFLLAKEAGDVKPDGTHCLKITHQELANFIGASRASVTSVLNHLEDQQLLKKGFRQIMIPSPRKLLDAMRV